MSHDSKAMLKVKDLMTKDSSSLVSVPSTSKSISVSSSILDIKLLAQSF